MNREEIIRILHCFENDLAKKYYRDIDQFERTIYFNNWINNNLK